jgi:hypothetical protein
MVVLLWQHLLGLLVEEQRWCLLGPLVEKPHLLRLLADLVDLK